MNTSEEDLAVPRASAPSDAPQGSFRIEKGIPLPSAKSAENTLLGTMRRMEVGDSILIPISSRPCISGYTQKIPGTKFATRTVDESSVRVWRIK